MAHVGLVIERLAGSSTNRRSFSNTYDISCYSLNDSAAKMKKNFQNEMLFLVKSNCFFFPQANANNLLIRTDKFCSSYSRKLRHDYYYRVFFFFFANHFATAEISKNKKRTFSAERIA